MFWTGHWRHKTVGESLKATLASPMYHPAKRVGLPTLIVDNRVDLAHQAEAGIQRRDQAGQRRITLASRALPSPTFLPPLATRSVSQFCAGGRPRSGNSRRVRDRPGTAARVDVNAARLELGHLVGDASVAGAEELRRRGFSSEAAAASRQISGDVGRPNKERHPAWPSPASMDLLDGR